MSLPLPPMIRPKDISAIALHELESSVVLWDVRTSLEYRWRHIPGALRMGRAQILAKIPQDQPIVVICLSGHRSIPGAKWLVNQGYQTVYNLKGGFWAWWRAGYPTMTGGKDRN